LLQRHVNAIATSHPVRIRDILHCIVEDWPDIWQAVANGRVQKGEFPLSGPTGHALLQTLLQRRS
jgi:hypothetical protein